MPKFLENALRHEARKKGLSGKHADRYVFGAMNNLEAVKGNKITPKGEAMERKHMAKEKKAPFHMTHITHHGDGSHTVEHEHHRAPQKGSGAFIERPENESYSVGNGKELISKLTKHLGIGAAPSPKNEESEMHAAKNEPPAAEIEEDSEGV